VRFAARFGFSIDPLTFDAARAAAPGLRQLSAERVRDEWLKGLVTAGSKRHFVELWQTVGAAAFWLPELRDSVPLPGAPDADFDPIVATVALCEWPAAVLRRLKASGAEIARAEAMERGPAEPAAGDPVSVRRWLAGVGEAADDLRALATLRRGEQPSWADTVAAVRRRGEATSRGQLAVTGDDLRAAGIPPGPELGRLLTRLLDAVLEDPSLNSRERLLELAHSWR